MSEAHSDSAAADSAAKPLAELVEDLLRQFSALLRKEFRLLQLELSETRDRVAVGLAMAVTGLIVALTAMNLLAAALVAGLVEAGLPLAWALLAVGVAVVLAALLLVRLGLARLRAVRLKPERTLRSITKAAEAFQETVR